jgi:UDP-N-acetylmuramoyl-L-alanyl-D-glutamate--2,6-diaminopimelate ligase
VFTNLTRDHLDFHGTMEEYFAAKQKLFAGPGGPPPACAVINQDDPRARELPLLPQMRVWRYGLGPESTLRARHISSGIEGLRFDVQVEKKRFAVESPLIGKINVYNILAACGAGLSYGLDAETIARGIASLRVVPGRFERIDEGQPFTVVVDYAHTDDALRTLTALAREFVAPRNDQPGRRVITLFGCGGDRDRAKRPKMGRAAGEGSDFVVLTSDNPRSEDPEAIMRDALPGLLSTGTKYVAEADRARAIRLAVEEARPGDIVLLAGKGHEKEQVLRDRTIPFDDAEVAAAAIREVSGVRA